MRNHVRRVDAEALIDGRPLTDEDAGALGDVQDFFTTMRNDFGAAPAPDPRPVLASILDGRRPLRTVAEPIATAPTRPATLPGWHRWPRPVAAAVATGTLLFSGLAAAGALPAPLQRVSADVGSSLGFDLPRPAGSENHAPPARTKGTRDDPGTGAGRVGANETRRPTDPAKPDLLGPSGSVATVPTAPALPLPPSVPLRRPVLPSVATAPAPIGSGTEGLLPNQPEVPGVVPSP